MNIPERASVGEIYTHHRGGDTYEVTEVVGDVAYLLKYENGWSGEINDDFFYSNRAVYTVTRKIMENV